MKTIRLEIPVAAEVEKPFVRHADVQITTPEQRLTLKRIIKGLDAAGTRTADGRRVLTGADAIRWLMEEATRHDTTAS